MIIKNEIVDLYEIVRNYFPEFEVSPSCHAATNLYTE